jgi:hypothetical protein
MNYLTHSTNYGTGNQRIKKLVIGLIKIFRTERNKRGMNIKRYLKQVPKDKLFDTQKVKKYNFHVYMYHFPGTIYTTRVFFNPCLGPTTVNREIYVALKVGEFTFFSQLAVDKIPSLLQKFND